MVSLIIGELIAWLVWPIVKNFENFQVIKDYFWAAPIIFPFLSLIGSWAGYAIGRRIIIFFQFTKFFQVGLLNTFLDLGILNLFVLFFGISQDDYRFSYFKGISFIIASTNSYFWNKHWSFVKKDDPLLDKRKEFIKFLTVSVIVFAVNVLIATYIFAEFTPSFFTIKEWGTISALFGVAFSMIANFLGYKFVVFKA